MIRRKFTDEDKAKIVQEIKGYLKGGMKTEEAYAKAGISKSNFYHWSKGYHKKRGPYKKKKAPIVTSVPVPEEVGHLIAFVGKPSDVTKAILQVTA